MFLDTSVCEWKSVFICFIVKHSKRYVTFSFLFIFDYLLSFHMISKFIAIMVSSNLEGS